MSSDAAASLGPPREPPQSGTSRVGPNTFIIGAAKSGTTALAEVLGSHPEICMASRKEPHHHLFETRPCFGGPGDEHWLARYAVPDRIEFASLFGHHAGEPIVVEASVYYLYRPDAIRRIEAERPGSRFIVMLRDPASRARSAYRHMVRDGREPETFERALTLEPARIAAGWEYGWHYLAVSRYAHQLERLFALVDRRRVHVDFYEHFEVDPVGVQRRIAVFLGVDPAGVRAEIPRLNVSGIPRSRTLHRLLDRPREYLPEGFVDRLGRARGLRAVRARLLERNLASSGAGPSSGPAPPVRSALELARGLLGPERAAVTSILGVTPPWD